MAINEPKSKEASIHDEINRCYHLGDFQRIVTVVQNAPSKLRKQAVGAINAEIRSINRLIAGKKDSDAVIHRGTTRNVSSCKVLLNNLHDDLKAIPYNPGSALKSKPTPKVQTFTQSTTQNVPYAFSDEQRTQNPPISRGYTRSSEPTRSKPKNRRFRPRSQSF